MRILIVDTYYPAFLESHYAERPELADAPYEVQWRALMDRYFGTSDAYSHFLGRLGHEARELVVNCRPMQSAWAREHAVRPARARFARDRSPVLDQVEEFRPDVVFVQDLNVFDPPALRALGARAQLLVGQIASAIPRRASLASYDLLVSSLPHFVERFRASGIESEHFRIGFDPRVLPLTANRSRDIDAVFVGAVGRSATWRSNALVERAAERAPIDFWGYRVGRRPLPDAVRRRYHGEAWGLDMYRVLARARIAVNRHGGVSGPYAANMRLYESTGVGALLVTDAKSNLAELFEPGEEVVTYTNEDELVTLIGHYLDDEAERARIAGAGQQRTMRDHTYERRMSELAGILARHVR
jgi:spore maturation protein CgeB